jgi:hypothetical protein
MSISYPKIRICFVLRATKQVCQTLRCLTLFRILRYKIGLFRILAYKNFRKGYFYHDGGLKSNERGPK